MREGCAGISRCAQTWSGDNETAWKTLRYNLTQGLNMSLSGLFSIGHDVGGFHGPTPGPELFVRFNEFLRARAAHGDEPWNATTASSTCPDASWRWRSACAISLRYRLMPYLYTLMWRASRDGVLAIRSAARDFPQDATAKIDDAFMLGPDVLVAPVLEEGARERSVYLPEHAGGWYDWHDGKHYPGGSVATVAAPLGQLPLFVRAGALILLGDATGINDLRELLVGGLVEGATGVVPLRRRWRDGGSRSPRQFRASASATAEDHGDGGSPIDLDRIPVRNIADGDRR